MPLGKSNEKPKWKTKGSIPIDKQIRNAIREKEKTHRSWIKSKKRDEASCLALRHQFTKARNKVNTLLRKEKRKLEREIALKAKSNPKVFWIHTRRSLKSKSGIAPLLGNPNNKDSMKFTDEDKASILLKQFSSIFTHEENGDIPRIESRTDNTISELQVEMKRVLEELVFE